MNALHNQWFDLINDISDHTVLKLSDKLFKDLTTIKTLLSSFAYVDSKPYLHYRLFYLSKEDQDYIAKVKEDQSIQIEKKLHKRRIRLDLSYDGTLYQGFQRQPHKETIQDQLEQCLTHLCQETILTHPASRTDKGVHAYHQVVHFDTTSSLSLSTLHQELNRMINQDIHIFKIQEVPQLFHARYDVLKKTYAYHITTEKNPFEAHYKLWVKDFNSQEAEKILSKLKGVHDFKHFAKAHKSQNTIKEIENIHIKNHQNDSIIYITGKGFLRHMVRMIMGHLFYELKHKKGTFFKAINDSDGNHQKHLAEAQALYLIETLYE